jgi:hypothetical protein
MACFSMKMTTMNKTIEVPILNNEFKVIVCFGDARHVAKVLSKYHYPDSGQLTVALFDRRRGATFTHPNYHPVIAMPELPRTPAHMGTLAHEAAHAVEHIFRFIEEPPGGEVFAHSIGAIVRETLNKLKKSKK